MTSAPFVPPLKCQGIKTKLVRDIANLAGSTEFDRWVEPFLRIVRGSA
jgi:DNA adenine methylase